MKKNKIKKSDTTRMKRVFQVEAGWMREKKTTTRTPDQWRAILFSLSLFYCLCKYYTY